MESYEIENIILELRKISAIKINRIQKKDTEENISEKTQDEDESSPSEISIAIKQGQDKKKIELFTTYRIPSIADFELEMDAEFVGFVSLKQALEIENIEIEKNPSILIELMKKDIFPKVFMELDKILLPIFQSMGVKYEKLVEKTGEKS